MPLLRDWTDSLTVEALDAYAERFFTRLLMKVDDYGRTHADARLLKSRLFPLKTDIRETDISRWLAECHKAGLLRFYVDGKGRTILEVFKFGQRKKFMRSDFDPPEGQVFLPLAEEKNLPARRREVEVEGKKKEPAPPLADKSALPKVAPCPKAKREMWQLLKDEAEIKARLKSERESAGTPDQELIASLKAKLKAIRDEMKQ
jgi:hypothetical protein